METLTEKVYECTLAVEAHMVCDLLARGGLSARVDGEFLTGAGGELPLGNTVKVRVDPARAAEAREIISDWEKLQPPEPSPPRRRSSLRSPLWFVAGVLVGGGIIYLAFNSPVTESGADFNGDGILEETYHYAGTTMRSVDIDRNNDGKVDARWTNDIRGVPDGYVADDDFDGRFEWVYDVRQGHVVAYTLDENGDGRPDVVTHLKYGVVRSVDIHDAQDGRIVSHQIFDNGWKTSADFDMDGDGIFERHVAYDRFGDPR